MKALVRLVLITVILAFAAGSVVHAVEASGMSVKMSAMAGGTAPGCDGCGSGGDDGRVDKTCFSLCVTPAIAVLPAATATAVRVSQSPGFRPAMLIAGQSQPPDPYPPKPALN